MAPLLQLVRPALIAAAARWLRPGSGSCGDAGNADRSPRPTG